MTETIYTAMCHTYDTETNWQSVNPVLKRGQIGVVSPVSSGLSPKLKVGNGVTSWNDLAYFSTAGLSAEDILALLINVDGSGSNLDADLLDGKHAHDFLLKEGGVVTGNLSIEGNLVVQGESFTVEASTVSVNDPVINLGGDIAPIINDNKDRGVTFRYHDGTSAKVGFFGYDASTGSFVFIPDATVTNEIVIGTPGSFKTGNIDLNGAHLVNIGQASNKYNDLTSSTSITPDFSLGQCFHLELAHSTTLNSPTNALPGQSGSIDIIQTAPGNFTMTFDDAYKFPGGVKPTLSTTSGVRDKLVWSVGKTGTIDAVLHKAFS